MFLCFYVLHLKSFEILCFVWDWNDKIFSCQQNNGSRIFKPANKILRQNDKANNIHYIIQWGWYFWYVFGWWDLTSQSLRIIHRSCQGVENPRVHSVISDLRLHNLSKISSKHHYQLWFALWNCWCCVVKWCCLSYRNLKMWRGVWHISKWPVHNVRACWQMSIHL